MKIMILIQLIFLISPRLWALDCTAIYQDVIDENSIEQSAPLKSSWEDPFVSRFTAEIRNFNFSVQKDKKTNTYLLMISIGPEFNKGVTAGMSWDAQNSMRLTQMDGLAVYKLICIK